MIFNIFGYGIMLLSFYLKSFAILIFSCIFLGFFTFPILPLSYELGCEISYPIGESFSTGLLGTSQTITSFILLLLYSLIFTSNSKLISYTNIFVFVGIIVISILIMVIVKEELKRTKAKKNNIIIENKMLI